jgi:ribonuclease HI
MNSKSNNEVLIFTDGSSKGNPGPGGWGVVVLNQGRFEVEELGGRLEHTTNNRMEIVAAIEALKTISDSSFLVKIYTDSSYLVNGITKWVFGWQKNGWKTATKTLVENQDLWQELIQVSSGKNIEWKLISGHSGLQGNERCDVIATSFAENKEIKLFKGPISKYFLKNILDINLSNASYKNKKSERHNDRLRSKMKAYSYVSLVQGLIKTHKTWAECEARVKGKNAKFKKAISEKEEKEIIDDFSS